MHRDLLDCLFVKVRGLLSDSYLLYNDHGNLILISNLINGQEVNVMTLTEHNLENNGKLTLGIKITRNQGDTMNVQV